MIKLASLVLASSFTLAGATIAAETTGSPTVSANPTGAQDLSYGDKSNTAKGTNAPMDDAKTNADSQAAPKKHKVKKAKVDATSHGTSTTAGTARTASEARMQSDTAITTAPPSAPTPGADAATVNSTTGKSGQ